MTTLELLQLQNEHKDNYFGKGEDATQEQKVEDKETAERVKDF